MYKKIMMKVVLVWLIIKEKVQAKIILLRKLQEQKRENQERKNEKEILTTFYYW